MTYNFVLQTAIFISLGVIIYLAARALPRVDGEDIHSPATPSLFDAVFSSTMLERADTFVNVILEKVLRRLKIIVMKADNFVSESLGKIKSKNQNGNGKNNTSS